MGTSIRRDTTATGATCQERSPRHVMALGLRNEGLAFFLRGFQAAMARAFVPLVKGFIAGLKGNEWF